MHIGINLLSQESDNSWHHPIKAGVKFSSVEPENPSRVLVLVISIDGVYRISTAQCWKAIVLFFCSNLGILRGYIEHLALYMIAEFES
jgi:hypothetical protein